MDWVPVGLCTGLPGIGVDHVRSIHRKLRNLNIPFRIAEGQGGRHEYFVDGFPEPARSALCARVAAQHDTEPTTATGDPPLGTFQLVSASCRDRAHAIAEALQRFQDEHLAELPFVEAVTRVATQMGVRESTVYRWLTRVDGKPRIEWAALLLHRNAGRQGKTDPTHARYFDVFRSYWLTTSRPTVAAAMRWTDADERTVDISPDARPSRKQVLRMIRKLPEGVKVRGRQGRKARVTARLTQRRDRSGLVPYQVVCADGHDLDVQVLREDGTVGTMMVVAFQDEYSGRILHAHLCRSESAADVRDGFRGMLGAMDGRVPKEFVTDNGPGFAAKVNTAGSENRYRRGRPKRDVDGQTDWEREVAGVFVRLGVRCRFVRPKTPEAKRIERAFRDVTDELRHPRFVGAYRGNAPHRKPEDANTRAVPEHEVRAWVAHTVAAHNARPGRRGANCDGRSLDETFFDVYDAGQFDRLDAEHLRLYLLPRKVKTPDRRNGFVEIAGHRYHTRTTADRFGQFVTEDERAVSVAFDPTRPEDPVMLYTLDGRAIGEMAYVQDEAYHDWGAAVEWRQRESAAMSEDAAAVKVLREAAGPMPAPPWVTTPVAPLPLPSVIRASTAPRAVGTVDLTDREGMKARLREKRAAEAAVAERASALRLPVVAPMTAADIQAMKRARLAEQLREARASMKQA